jgi:predicted lipid-binding transport protein (Tim44 family)
MSDGFQYFDIIFFALIAVFVILRLRSALGRRTGQNRHRPGNIFSRSTEPDEQKTGKVIHLPSRGDDSEDEIFEKELLDIDGREDKPAETKGDDIDDIRAALSQIRMADPDFSPRTFVAGAKGAFEMIVEAFAAGDTATLRPLLGDDVYDEFADVIRARIAAKETVETTIVALDSVDIAAASLTGSTARLTIKFVSQQMSVTRDESGAEVEGEPEAVVRVIDLWTFARNTNSIDPNWAVVETRTPD